MKESEFIEQNKEKWLEFEKNLLKKDVDPSKTSKLFVQITDDLSYARTFYNNRSVKLYLNGIAKLLFNDLNRSQSKKFEGFFNFWKSDLPLAMYKSRRAMLISFLVFIFCFSLGVITSIHDKKFANTILSSRYVSMTNENIKKGDAMAVYKSESELRTFLPILVNNLKVDFLTFFSGVFFAIGSLVIMIGNGVMVGVFQYFFIERGLFWESFLGIWTHGSLEIPTIILSGGAGLTLGKGLLFPGTHSRTQAFKLSGMLGLKIIMGVAPLTVLAAFVEGFITRHTDIPNPIRFTFILISFAFILLYYFWYPRRVAKSAAMEHLAEDKTLVYSKEEEFDTNRVYPTMTIITETFHQLFYNFVFFGKYILLASLIAALFVANNPLNLFHNPEYFGFNISDYFNFADFPAMGLLIGILLTSCSIIYFNFLRKKLKVQQAAGTSSNLIAVKAVLSIIICFALYVGIIYTSVDYTILGAHLLFNYFVFVCAVSVFQRLSFFDAIAQATKLLSQSWSRFLLAAAIFTILSLIVYATSMYGLRTLFLQDALVWMLTDDELVGQKIQLGLFVFQASIALFLFLSFVLISNSLLYFTLKESYTASHLIKRIQAIGISK